MAHYTYTIFLTFIYQNTVYLTRLTRSTQQQFSQKSHSRTHHNTRKDLLEQMSHFNSGLTIYCIGLLGRGKKKWLW